ncbi:peptidase domain-containing ABC transporter [Algoriphagus winogradskyi]|uniref:ABC-type bacteriocin/lantibiotic exporter, contains an N-terminal double-glycine peptidase domain n=1 Tax=Algoriphagus winogradskyi TaxID=237017 RepID=A0ABY1P729_9BACT|nr:ATP-binding cassette domain-containing protein [Algoriphagus winogradskyi]SMP25640.1 ABC-type bacteriocin/lantibiotic exporter, contains an N-terminal double-glycine peptidase domain [Algoriphagus winogradskyi]
MNNTKTTTPMKRFFNLLKEEKEEVYSIYFYAILNGLVALSLPLGIQAILNFVLGGRITTSWVILVLVVAAGIAFGGFLQISQLQITEKLQQRIFAKSGLSLAYRLPKVKSELLHGAYAPEIVNRFFDTVNLQKGVSKILVEYSTALIQVIFGLILLSFYHATFILFGIVLVLILITIFYFTSPKGMATALKESTYKYETAYWLEEIGRTLNTFKLVGGNSKLPILRVDKLLKRYIDFRSNHFSVLILQYKVLIGFKVLIVTSLLIAGSLLLINDQISIGQFVAAEVIILMVVNAVEKLILSLETVYDTLVATEKLGQVMDIELEDHKESEKDITQQSNGIKLAMENLVFQPRDVSKPIVNGVTLTIEPGVKAAITGKSGSGKSAMLALFSGLYQTYKGTIKINDLSLDLIHLDKYRTVVGDCMELQQIFHGSIAENILVGREIDPEQLKFLIELVGLKEFIYQLPDDLNTILLPEGRGLSRKMAQAIMLARALVGQPKAMILENALLHLDEEVKNRVQSYLFQGDWTLLMVTQDVDVIKSAQQVIVMDNGTMIYQGNQSGYQNFLNTNA